MSGNTNPTPSQILAALRNGGVDLKTYKGWDTVGRPWKGPDGSPGLMGVVCHHTANPNADQGLINSGMLEWATTAYDKPVCNLIVGKFPGQTYLLSAGSAYHCGDGGPIPELGIPARGYLGQTRLFGIEIDDPGIKASTLTPYQIENVGRAVAALATLCGWNVDKSVITHKCYTDLCHTEAKRPGECLGRKNDTLDGAWQQFPGDPNPQPYNAPWWREQTKQWMAPPATWDGTVPSLRAVQKADAEGLCNKAAWRVACRLFDLGFKRSRPAAVGTQHYPTASVLAFQKAQGLPATGDFDAETQVRLFGKVKP